MIHIITDTTSGLPPEIAARYHIPVIPQVIHFGSESFYEGIELDNAAFMKRLRAAKELPKTAAPPPELFVKEFERLVPLGEPILCIHPSAEISGTIRAATVAAQDFPDADIRVIDTRMVASPLATLVELAAGWAVEGVNVDTIIDRLKDFSGRCRIYFLVDTLDYLVRGGRIGGATGLIGSVLQIKPILALQDGKVEPYERERTHKRALARLKEIAIEQFPRNQPGYLSVLHAAVPDQAKDLAQELGAALSQTNVPILDVPPTIVVHGGPGILGVAFFVAS